MSSYIYSSDEIISKPSSTPSPDSLVVTILAIFFRSWIEFFTAILFGVILNPIPERAVSKFLNALRLFGLGYSWGGYESLILLTNPAQIRTVTKNQWENGGPTLRIHAGLEDIDDLIADLEKGFQRLNSTT